MEINRRVWGTANFREIYKLPRKNNASKLVKELKQNVFDLGEKLEKNPKENEVEVTHEELGEAKKVVSLHNLDGYQLIGVHVSYNVLELLHRERIVEKNVVSKGSIDQAGSYAHLMFTKKQRRGDRTT